jgi:hypothetical protein
VQARISAFSRTEARDINLSSIVKLFGVTKWRSQNFNIIMSTFNNRVWLSSVNEVMITS